jgi:hypothetical protein
MAEVRLYLNARDQYGRHIYAQDKSSVNDYVRKSCKAI